MRILTAVLVMIIAGLAGASTLVEQYQQDNELACLDCHNSVLSGNQHFIESSDECLYCHENKGPTENGHRVITSVDDNICLACHIEQDPMISSSQHSLINCVDCHNPHGSKEVYNMNYDMISLCADNCHDHNQLGNSHPVGARYTDKRTGDEMTCVSTCHSVHTPREPKLLRYTSEDLCRQCHESKY